MDKTLSQSHNRRVVLIVDDQEINRELLGMILEDDYDLLFAENGQQALDVIREKRDILSIVLLDLMMPVMDGFQVLEYFRADEALRRLPIIVLTAEKSAELRALQLGAADFITKPFEMHEVILARVGRIIELSEGRQLIQAAERDSVTDLYTNRFFVEYAQQIQRYHPDWEMDALALNIERFHLVNELRGREYGDRVLRTLADKLGELLSESAGLASRDADMFYIFCRHRDDYDEIVRRLQDSLRGLVQNLRLRLGVYEDVDTMQDIERQFDRAKTACNMLRGNYTQSVLVYDKKLHRKEIYSQNLINDIHKAVAERQFKVFFQPKYDITGDKPVLRHAEALIRWQHPEYGMVSPGDFIPLFENNGLIPLVDYYVWKDTAAQIRRWKEKYGWSVHVSVNLSRIDMFDPELESKLMALVNDNGLDPEDMHLEVTESAYTDDASRIIEVVESLRKLGFKIEMDDFGAGYSSLNMISSLPIDVLKMDMKFIQNVRAGIDKDMRMIRLILDIAEYLSVPVVAEGVETAEEVELLRQAGCSYIQGYYFSKPVPPEEFERFIEAETEHP